MPLTSGSVPHLHRPKPPVETFQTPFELQQMLAIYDHLQPARTLEVGSWDGGTLWHFIAHPATRKVVAVDDRMRQADEWMDWADQARVDLHLFHGSSHDPAIVDAVGANGPYDFVLIDGDHRPDAVTADWENYGPMVATGGAFAFHDILKRDGYGVWQVWNELKGVPGARTVEITVSPNPDDESERNGIGILWP